MQLSAASKQARNQRNKLMVAVSLAPLGSGESVGIGEKSVIGGGGIKSAA